MTNQYYKKKHKKTGGQGGEKEKGERKTRKREISNHILASSMLTFKPCFT